MGTKGELNMDDIEIELDTLKITGDATKLYEELAKAALEFLPVPKASQGQIGQQKFKYAGYAKLMRCVRPALSAHGIVILQPLHSRENLAITTTILAGHGATIQSSFAFDAEFRKKQKDGNMGGDPQEFGRHHTYYRRYQLQAILGLEGDADADDLPDVNEEREQTQYTEPARDATTGEAVPAKPAKPPKAKVSAEPKSADADTSKSSTSAKSSEPMTNGKRPTVDPGPTAEPKVEPMQSVKTVNELLQAGMKELSWKMADVREFYKAHIDPAGFDKADNLSIEQKSLLHKKMVEVHNVIPF